MIGHSDTSPASCLPSAMLPNDYGLTFWSCKHALKCFFPQVAFAIVSFHSKRTVTKTNSNNDRDVMMIMITMITINLNYSTSKN